MQNISEQEIIWAPVGKVDSSILGYKFQIVHAIKIRYMTRRSSNRFMLMINIVERFSTKQGKPFTRFDVAKKLGE